MTKSVFGYIKIKKRRNKIKFTAIKGSRKKSPLPPFELNGRWNVGTWRKKGSKTSSFFLNGPALTPPLLLMARQFREKHFLRLP